MSWAVGFDSRWNRDIGYGVPATCDHPKCNAEIDRGLSYVCGGKPYGGDIGCGLYFCSEHLFMPGSRRDCSQLCPRCLTSHYGSPYKPKPDSPEWLRWKLRDPSWKPWRDKYPEKVAEMRLALRSQITQPETR